MRTRSRTAWLIVSAPLTVCGGVLANFYFRIGHARNTIDLAIFLFGAVGLPILFYLCVGIEPGTKRLYWRTRKARQAEALEDEGAWIKNCSFPPPPASRIED